MATKALDTKPGAGRADHVTAPASEARSLPLMDDFIARIRSKDDAVRGPAWQGAAPYGAPAVIPLGGVMTDTDFEIARSARRALWRIVRHAGRPGAAREANAVSEKLIVLLADSGTPVRREVIWMLSEIAGDEAVAPLSALLTDKELRDDARCSLTRIPGRKSLSALKAALATVPDDFKPALADSLRTRGQKVASPPTRKLAPTKQTTVGR